jgi:hypothetical protein
MSFTFAIPFNDISRLRFRTGDTDPAAFAWSDELITAVMAEEDGSWKRAAVALVKARIAETSASPDFTADWLMVDVKTQVKNDRDLLADLLADFGEEVSGSGPTMTSDAVFVYRVDSDQTEPPYSDVE